MNIEDTDLPGVVLITPKVFGDQRGFFFETWNRQSFRELGLDLEFVQDNVSLSRQGILRGLHFQNPQPQGKLVQVLQGEVFDVVVDVRLGSPMFGRWFGAYLSSENPRQIYIPPGLAHGFCVTSDLALFAYKCTDFYNPGGEFSLRWDDPDLGIVWPIEKPTLSAKDAEGLTLKDLPAAALLDFR
jgi:dTDP-4-dehydrorhamnose 3,5-epimerase